jgi:tetratricopeptide (TPR) repeat protein
MAGARIGVHRMHIPADRLPKGHVIDANAALEFVQKRLAFVVEYLNSMDVSPEVQRRTFATASKEIYVLTDDDLDGSKVIRLERSGGAWMPRSELANSIQLPSNAVIRSTKIDQVPQSSPSTSVHPTLSTEAWPDCIYGSTDERKIEGCSRVLQGPRSAYSSEQTVTAYRTRGQAYSRMGRHDLAVTDHTSAYALDASNPAHLVDRGGAYHRLGNYTRAITDFDSAIQRSPSFARAYTGRAKAHEANSSWALALADFETALRLQPSDEDAASGRRRMQAKIASLPTVPSRVENSEQRGSTASTRSIQHLARRAADCSEEADPDRRISACTEILASKQEHQNHNWLVSAYTHKGDAYMAKGWYTAALYDYNSALDLSRFNPYAWARRADANLALGRYNDAISDYSSAISLTPTATLHSQRGAVFVKVREYDKAISDFDKAIDLNSALAIAHVGRGDAHAGRGEHSKALVDYERALVLDPSLAQAREAKQRIMSTSAQLAPAETLTSSGSPSEALLRREATRCRADGATYNREDGSQFAADRFGKLSPFARIFAGDFRGRRAYLVEQPMRPEKWRGFRCTRRSSSSELSSGSLRGSSDSRGSVRAARALWAPHRNLVSSSV